MDVARVESLARLQCPVHSVPQELECNCVWRIHGVPVTPQLQRGPTCGLVALAIAEHHFRPRNHVWNVATSKAAPEQYSLKLDVNIRQTLAAGPPPPPPLPPQPNANYYSFNEPRDRASELLQHAIDRAFSRKGEMFSADWLAHLARECSLLDARVVIWEKDPAGGPDVKEALDAGGLVLVAYDKDGNHEPCLKGGTKAHWALVHGYAMRSEVDHDGTPDFLLCTHGKSLHQAVWSQERLYASCWNLEAVNAQVLNACVQGNQIANSHEENDEDYLETTTEVSGRERKDSIGYELPQPDGSLATSLRGKIIILSNKLDTYLYDKYQ